MMRLLFAVVLALSAATSIAQSGKRQDGRPTEGRQMSREERQRMREDVRDAYRDRQGSPDRQQKTRQQMSPEERGQLRRDIEDANRQMRR